MSKYDAVWHICGFEMVVLNVEKANLGAASTKVNLG